GQTVGNFYRFQSCSDVFVGQSPSHELIEHDRLLERRLLIDQRPDAGMVHLGLSCLDGLPSGALRILPMQPTLEEQVHEALKTLHGSSFLRVSRQPAFVKRSDQLHGSSVDNFMNCRLYSCSTKEIDDLLFRRVETLQLTIRL